MPGVRNSSCLECSTYALHCFCRERNFWQAKASSLAALPQWKLDRSCGDASWRSFDGGGTAGGSTHSTNLYTV